MPRTANAVVVAHNDDPLPHWPLVGDPGTVPAVAFRAAIIDRTTVAIVQVVGAGDAIASSRVAWSAGFEDETIAAARFRWLDAHPAACTRLGRHALLFGPAHVGSEVEVGVEIQRIQDERERVRVAEREEQARHEAAVRAEKARTITSFVEDRHGQYGISLQRGDVAKPFWIILFRERWERERFRDWFRCQKHHWADWADFLDQHDAIDLERLLLAEMLETERRVKKAGLGAGGRRPLRFWRGEQ